MRLVKFSARTAGATIEVGARDGDGGSVYYVKDNGAGFDPRFAGRLFHAFQRLHSADDYPGTGVGLAIVHSRRALPPSRLGRQIVVVTRSLAALVLAAALASCRLERAPAGRPGGFAPEPDSVASAEVYAVVRGFYAAATSRDWRLVGDHFWPRATISAVGPAPGDTASRVRTVPIEAFVASGGAWRADVVAGEAVHATIVTYGALADAWVTSQARGRDPAQGPARRYGIDAFHLMKLGGRWRIVSLALQAEVPGAPIAPGPVRR